MRLRVRERKEGEDARRMEIEGGKEKERMKKR